MSMTLAENGPHDWQDFIHYWREADAEWLQSRSILRVLTPGDLSSITTPGIGQVVHVKTPSSGPKDILYMYASEGTGVGVPGWTQYAPFPKNLSASPDTPSQVMISHAGVQSLSFSPSGGVAVPVDFTARATVFKVTAANVAIKTGAATALLTTDATSLVSSIPIKSASLVSTGSITTATLTSSGLVTAQAGVTVTGTVSATAVSAATVTSTTFSAAATGTSNGFRTGIAAFVSDAGGVAAHMQRTDWTNGKAEVKVELETVTLVGGSIGTSVENSLHIRGNRSIEFWNGTPGGRTGYLGPVIYQASDPGAVPNGTIWVSP